MTRIETLMLVDDNDIDQRIFKRIIQRSGLVDEVLTFQSGMSALEYLLTPHTKKPALILLDINMPIMSGFEFLEHLQEAFGDQGPPVVVMLTTSLDPGDRLRAEQCDVVRDFLNKPLALMDIERLVEIAALPAIPIIKPMQGPEHLPQERLT